MYQEITGNLIDEANKGRFDLIAHGCNCFCTMGAGIAPHMHRNYGCNDPKLYPYESKKFEGFKAKLGKWQLNASGPVIRAEKPLMVANIYSQFHYNWKGPNGIQLEYDALEKALHSMGKTFALEEMPLEIGLPLIGCGLAGGDWSIVSEMIQENLEYHNVTVVILPENQR